ncbi:MAG: outer membrane protein assembly factor BamC [Paraglaciecola sp.]|jgi:outer membrane protein assembly factor BamC
MTYKLSVSGAIVIVALAACTTVQEREVASGGFEYLSQQPGQTIKVPEGVDTPNFNDTYKLPELGENAQTKLLGNQLSVISPSLVLPLVTGSHVEEGSKSATVWFDQIDDSQPLDTTVWNSLLSFLEEQGIGVESFDKEAQRLVSDWMSIELQDEDSSWYSWTKTERSIGQRFEFNLDIKPHGRTASLHVALVDYKEIHKGKVVTKLENADVRRNEVDILNKVIGHYEYQIRVADAERIREIRRGLAMELGSNEDGDAAFVVDASYDVAWPRFLLVLRKLGFDVKDYDKSNGLLFVNYNGSADGWWSSLWADSEDKLSLDKAEYRFKIGDLGEKTSVTVLDNESKPFAVDKLSDMYKTFSRTMAADDLDI